MTTALLIGFALLVVAVVAWRANISGAAGTATGPSAGDRAQVRQTRVSAPDCPPGSKRVGRGCIDRHPVAIVRCPSAKKAVKFYSSRVAYWRDKMGAGVAARLLVDPGPRAACPRYLAHVLQRKAYGLRKAYPRWRKRVWEHDYAWWLWLPAKYQRVGRCETGGTPGATAAGNWHWDSGTYVSAFGIIRAAFPTWNGHNTPREQYEVAASIQARYGWGAWGCGGA